MAEIPCIGIIQEMDYREFLISKQAEFDYREFLISKQAEFVLECGYWFSRLNPHAQQLIIMETNVSWMGQSLPIWWNSDRNSLYYPEFR